MGGAWRDVACSVGRGSFDPLSLGGRRRVLRSNWAGWPAFLVFVWTAIVLPWSPPSQPRAKTKIGLEFRFRFRLARRMESNQIGVDQTGQEDPFSTLYPCDLIGSRRRLLGDFVTGYSKGTRQEPSIYSLSLSLSLCDKSSGSFPGAALSTRWVFWENSSGGNNREGASVASDQHAWSEKCAWL